VEEVAVVSEIRLDVRGVREDAVGAEDVVKSGHSPELRRGPNVIPRVLGHVC